MSSKAPAEGSITKADQGQRATSLQNSFQFTIREAFGVMRPAASAIYVMTYLNGNKNPSLAWLIYFATLYPLAGNAGNDYIDWEHDRADKSRVADWTRGMASSKQQCWWFYALSTVATYAIGLMDPGFAVMYFVWIELVGQWFYNGIFLGIPMNSSMNSPSIIKQIGFPLDLVINAVVISFPAMVASRSWVPPLDLCAAATALSIWSQLKDYEFEKGTAVRTTATILGYKATCILALLTLPVMLHGNLGYLPYCIYFPLRLLFPHKLKKLRNSHVMLLSLFLIVLVQFMSPFFSGSTLTQSKAQLSKWEVDQEHRALGVKNILLWVAPNTNMQHVQIYMYLLMVAVLTRVLLYVAASFFNSRFYFALLGIYHRKRPYDPKVWEEQDPRKLLLKVMPQTGRSGTALVMLFPEKDAPGTLYAYLVFRVQDSWADVCIGRENRIEGLAILPVRLRMLMRGQRPPTDNFANKVPWNAESPKNVLHIDIVKNLQRFDDIFLSLSPAYQELIAKYSEDMRDGLIELELRQDEPPSRELTRRTSEVACGFAIIGLMGACGLHQLAKEVQSKPRSKVAQSFEDFTDFIMYPQLASTIEEDVREGVIHDTELVGMQDMDPDILTRVKGKWVRLALDFAENLDDFLLHPDIEESLTVRIGLLGFVRFTVEVLKRLVAEELEVPVKKTSPWKVLFGTMIESYFFGFYKERIRREAGKAQELRKELAGFDKHKKKTN